MSDEEMEESLSHLSEKELETLRNELLELRNANSSLLSDKDKEILALQAGIELLKKTNSGTNTTAAASTVSVPEGKYSSLIKDILSLKHEVDKLSNIIESK